MVQPRRRGRARRDVRRVQRERVERGPAPGDVRLSVVVPAYMEGEQAAVAVRELRAALAGVTADGGVELVVVDDGSTDGTADAARRAGADQVLVLPRNRGKGAAVRAGMLAARGRTIAYTDADLSYPPDQLIGLLDAVEDGWDMVVGSRRHIDTTTLVRARRLREVTGRVFNVLTSVVLLGQYRDTQCGLKAFRSDVARILFAKQRLDGFAFDVELFHLAERYRLSLVEAPVTLANATRSSVRVVSAAARMVRDLARVRLASATGTYDLSPEETAVISR